MKISQMYYLMLMLLNNRKLTREYVAEKLEISDRTVQRYVDALCLAGIPIETTIGRSGGYSIPDDFKLPCTLFSAEDIERIITSLTAMSHSFGDQINNDLLQKLLSVSGNGVRSVSTSVIIDAAAWNNPEALRGKLDAVAAATEQRITIKIGYTDKAGQASERLLDPYCLVLKEGIWYVYGWCHSRGQFRLFRLARMRAITLTGETYIEREGADVAAALSLDMPRDITLKIEFDQGVLAKIEEWLGEDAVKFDNGSYTATALVAEGNELVSHLLSFGANVTVISPESVRQSIAEAAANIIKKY